MKAILGRKMGMTEVFAEDGTMYPVTVVEVLPKVVTQVKTVEKDGYVAVQVGYEEKKESRANKCELGIAKKANTVPHQVSAELRGDEMANYKLGDKITVDLFYETISAELLYSSSNLDATGIQSNKMESDDVYMEIYDMNGIRLQHLRKGLNIVKMGDGTVRKIWHR